MVDTVLRQRILNVLPDKKLSDLVPWKFKAGSFDRDQMIEYITWYWNADMANRVSRYLSRGLEVGFNGK